MSFPLVRECLKRGLSPDERVIPGFAPDEDDAFSGIRCPLCEWQPGASDRWCCDATESPEPVFPGCGAIWNTFATRGLCPGCSHQWRWTSCLACHGWSLHQDWYFQESSRRPQ